VDTDACRGDCLALGVCGDGVLRTDVDNQEAPYELCDDANEVDDDRCTNTCQSAMIPEFVGELGPNFLADGWVQCGGWLDRPGGNDIPSYPFASCVGTTRNYRTLRNVRGCDRVYNETRVVCGSGQNSYRYMDIPWAWGQEWAAAALMDYDPESQFNYVENPTFSKYGCWEESYLSRACGVNPQDWGHYDGLCVTGTAPDINCGLAYNEAYGFSEPVIGLNVDNWQQPRSVSLENLESACNGGDRGLLLNGNFDTENRFDRHTCEWELEGCFGQDINGPRYLWVYMRP
jgi:hypothetical protein